MTDGNIYNVNVTTSVYTQQSLVGALRQTLKPLVRLLSKSKARAAKACTISMKSNTKNPLATRLCIQDTCQQAWHLAHGMAAPGPTYQW